MTSYIKVRPYVAQKLGVEDARYHYADGNVLLWDKELTQIDSGWVFHPEETVARIGGLMMDPYRNKEEQARSAEDCTPLPLPTDPEWMDPESMTNEGLSEIIEEAGTIMAGIEAEELLAETIEAVEEGGGL